MIVADNQFTLLANRMIRVGKHFCKVVAENFRSFRERNAVLR